MAQKLVADFAEPQLYIVDEFPAGGDGGPDPTKPIPEEPTDQISLRSVLGSEFPASVKARRSRHGTHVVLPQSECRRAFQRLRAHAVAYADLHRWGMAQPRGSCTPSVAVTFWYTVRDSSQNGGVDPEGGADPICPEVVVTGLKSAVSCFDVVELLCYQPFVRKYLKKRFRLCSCSTHRST